MPNIYQAYMNPSYVVYGACTRGCDVDGYKVPQGPQKLLDNGDFGATWEHSPKVKAHYLKFSNVSVQMRYSSITPYYPLATSQF
ncbi:unnamed protein product [Prunus armeniaca]